MIFLSVTFVLISHNRYESIVLTFVSAWSYCIMSSFYIFLYIFNTSYSFIYCFIYVLYFMTHNC